MLFFLISKLMFPICAPFLNNVIFSTIASFLASPFAGNPDLQCSGFWGEGPTSCSPILVFIGSAAKLDRFFPIKEAFSMMGILVALQILVTGWQFIKFLTGFIPGINLK